MDTTPVETNFHLYVHQYDDTPKQNQAVVVRPSLTNSFGTVAANNWTVREGAELDSKMVARLRGETIGTNQDQQEWYCSFNMVFNDERFKGSTLQIKGQLDLSSPALPFEWAITGGTGQFTLAQGVVYGKPLSAPAKPRIMELFVRVFYRPLGASLFTTVCMKSKSIKSRRSNKVEDSVCTNHNAVHFV